MRGKEEEERGQTGAGGGHETVKRITLLSLPVSLEATQVPYTKLSKLYLASTKYCLTRHRSETKSPWRGKWIIKG